MSTKNPIPNTLQQNRQPGIQSEMDPLPEVVRPNYKGSDKLKGKTALITGGDSGIGRTAAVYFAKEGADIFFTYLDEDQDAQETKKLVEQEGVRCECLAGDVGDESFCQKSVDETIKTFGKLDILVNNAGEQHVQKNFLDITSEQMEKTFRTNFFGYFYMAKAALPHMKEGATIINTTSVTAYEGHPELIDYSATKGAIVAFTRALSNSIAGKGIRVNGVAPGPIWTPLIPSTFPAEQVKQHGGNTPIGRRGQPSELGATYVYLASDDSSYVSGQILHVNGGQVVNG
ncbi:SDR family oxidoreductase [Bacillus testis]|uniref:SDR family oxidoreductase n=1 Tax=Bacillus testis TaxID=1622072 RepID=UPI00067EF19A|nr:SDR family oxidoreductase [Bacillus testis]